MRDLAKNAARKYGLSERDEMFARFLAELIAGTPYTIDEVADFEATQPSQEWHRNVGNAAIVLLAGPDKRRKQLYISLIDSPSPIAIGGSPTELTYANGLHIASGAERAMGNYPGAVYAIANVAGPLDIAIRAEYQ